MAAVLGGEGKGAPAPSVSEFFECASNRALYKEAVPVAEQPYEDCVGTRYAVREEVFEGLTEIVQLRPDFYVVACDHQLTGELIETTRGDGWLTLHFRLEGVSKEVFGNLAQETRESSKCYIVVHPEGVDRTQVIRGGTRVRSVALSLKPAVLLGALRLSLEELPKPLQLIAEGESSAFYWQNLPISVRMHQILEDIFGLQVRGGLRRLYLEALATELVVLVLERLRSVKEENALPVVLKPRDIARLHEAREIIASRIADPLTIEQLSRRVALNTKKLKFGFPHLFGVTVFEYCQELRMMRALELLKDRDLSIAQISFDLGYAHPSNFTAAFKRRFGVLPKAFRRDEGGPQRA